ncbi:MAG: TIM barrel protein [Devosia sp.]
MTRYSACIEWLFAKEAPAFPDRIRAAKEAGLDGIEFWLWSNKDLDAVKAALDETGLPMAGILCEPISKITDTEAHAMFLEGIRASLLAALKLGAPMMIAQAGDDRPGVPRETQHAALVKVLKDAADILKGSGVVLALEPLNDRVDHPGYYLTSTVEGLDIVDEVDRPEVKLLYDIYHSAMMGEHIEDVLDGRLDRIVHVHLADTQGRGEPGSGAMDWQARLDWLADHGYDGFVGLEYRPTGSTIDSLKFRG